MDFDWHEVAIYAIGGMVLLVGVIWTLMLRWIKSLSASFTEHVENDAVSFREMSEKIDASTIRILERISGRWQEDRRH